MNLKRQNRTHGALAGWMDANGIAFERIEWARGPVACAPFLVLTDQPVAVVLARGNETGDADVARLARLKRSAGIPCAIVRGPADRLLAGAQAVIAQAAGLTGYTAPDTVTIEVSK